MCLSQAYKSAPGKCMIQVRPKELCMDMCRRRPPDPGDATWHFSSIQSNESLSVRADEKCSIVAPTSSRTVNAEAPTHMPEPPITHKHQWKSGIVTIISTMDAVLNAASNLDAPVDNFESAIAAYMNEDPFELYQATSIKQQRPVESPIIQLKPSLASERLQNILQYQLPTFLAHANTSMQGHRRPSRLVRYWLPATALLVGSFYLLVC